MTQGFSIATPAGPWIGNYKSRDEALENAGVELSGCEDEHWFIRHPDGRTERVNYYGEHILWT